MPFLSNALSFRGITLNYFPKSTCLETQRTMICVWVLRVFFLELYSFILGPAYNEQFNVQDSARWRWVIVLTELCFNIVDDDWVLS